MPTVKPLTKLQRFIHWIGICDDKITLDSCVVACSICHKIRLLR